MASCATPAVERKGPAVGFEPNEAEVKVLPERRPRPDAAPVFRESDVRGSNPTRRRIGRALVVAGVAIALLTTMWPASVTAQEPAGLDRFLWALGQVESGGRYDAQNANSGAYGKYQIMPSNWPAWAHRYLGDPHAQPTPHNQEVVARGRVRDLYLSLSDWAAVAHWWLTGDSSAPSAWSALAVRYVQRIMDVFGGGTDVGRDAALSTSAGTRMSDASTSFQEASASIDYGGHWGVAAYGAYSNGHVRYSGTNGASASFSFVGRSITWFGPVGPTRGKARILFDGHAVKVVNLQRATFRPSVALYERSWKATGRHTLTIAVLDAPGKGLVAIDRFVVER